MHFSNKGAILLTFTKGCEIEDSEICRDLDQRLCPQRDYPGSKKLVLGKRHGADPLRQWQPFAAVPGKPEIAVKTQMGEQPEQNQHVHDQPVRGAAFKECHEAVCMHLADSCSSQNTHSTITPPPQTHTPPSRVP